MSTGYTQEGNTVAVLPQVALYRRRPRGQPATGAGDVPAWTGNGTVLSVAENLG